MSITYKKIEKCKGLNQTLDFPDLPLDYAHRLKNIDVDDPLGKMRVRDGYSKKYSTAFTDLRSAYEYYFKEADDTKFFVNDNGSIRISTDGAAFGGGETLPTGATIETNFKCHWMGYKNHVLMTTGNGDTNYVLGYYYVKRVAADNTGLFGNLRGNTGYLWSKAQLICPNGTFSNVKDVVYVDGYYYLSFYSSPFIEKRDTDLHLLDRFTVDTGYLDDDGKLWEASGSASSVALATDGTYIYTMFYSEPAVTGGNEDVRVEKVTPDGWIMEAGISLSLVGAADSGDPIGGICTDGTNVFCATTQTSGTNGRLIRFNSSLVIQENQNHSGMLDVCCDDDTTITTGKVYMLTAAGLYQYSKDDMLTEDTSNTTYSNHLRCFCQVTGTEYVYASSSTGDGAVYRYTAGSIATVSTVGAVYEPQAFFPPLGDDTVVPYAISSLNGTVQEIESGSGYDTIYPRLASLNIRSTEASGSLGAGTYYYKISLVDTDGQEYTSSDPIVQTIGASYNINLRIICNHTDLNDFYRVKSINVYRGYTDSGLDSATPGTEYKLLTSIDINDGHWEFDNVTDIYTFDYIDKTTEATISDVTYFENSGIGDNVKPRYVNGKYFTWLDNQLHLANFSHDGDTYVNRVVRSSNNAPDAISFYDYYNFDVSEGDAIKGISNLYGRSVVWKTRKMATFYDGSQEREFIEGLSAENGYFAKDDAVYYISNKGIHVFDGNKVHDLTDNVRYYFELDTDLDQVGVFYFDNKSRMVWSIHSASNPRTLVLNIKHKTWTYYDKAWKGFFKNNSNEYIGWQTSGGSGYLCELFDSSTKDLEDVGGGNGSAISIEYQSPLIKATEIDGLNAMMLGYWWRGLCSGTLSVKLYKYKTDGKTLIDTYTISSPTGNAAVKNHYLQSEWGESYAITIDGSTPTTPASQSASFNFYSMTFKIKQMGMVDAV